MKKMLAGLGVVAALALVAFAAHAFDVGGVKVPTTANEALDAPGTVEYDQCKAYANKYSNSADVNSRTLPNILSKDLGSPTKTMRDDRKDKKDTYGNWEAQYKYGKTGMVSLQANCDYKKCYSVYCNK